MVAELDDGGINNAEAQYQKRKIEFCESGVDTMSRYYHVKKADFEEMLKKGYTQIEFGRGPLGWSNKRTGEYIVAFAAFSRNDFPIVETFEVRKVSSFFATTTKGLSKRHYLAEKYRKTEQQFELFLISEDLAAFIQRFNWPPMAV
jgi:hypothetical protein